MLSEFDLIKRYFRRAPGSHHGHPGHAVLGIGDDCALLAPTPGMQTAVSTDLLVEGRHFFAGADAEDDVASVATAGAAEVLFDEVEF